MMLLRIIRLNMHIMTCYSTSDLFVSIKRQIFAVQRRSFTYPMSKIDPVALLTDRIEIHFEFSLA